MKIVGIDLGGTKVRGVLADGTGKLLARTERKTEATKGLEHVVSNIGAVIREVCQQK